MRFIPLLLAIPLIAIPLHAFAEPAVVRSAVNIRTAPNSSNSRVVGALKAGDEISVTCRRGWCEMADGRGFVAQRFLRLGAGGGGRTAAPAPAEPEQQATATAAEPEPAPAPALEPAAPETGGIFNGLWVARNDTGTGDIRLTIQQVDTNALAIMEVGDITTTMSGRIEGMRFIFAWENTRSGQMLLAGDGFLNFVGDNALSGVLMHNGSAISSVTATR
jgi:hypothetical protein